MPTDFSEMSDAELQAERDRITGCLHRAHDLFSRMLLSGRLKAIYREIYERPLWQIAK